MSVRNLTAAEWADLHNAYCIQADSWWCGGSRANLDRLVGLGLMSRCTAAWGSTIYSITPKGQRFYQDHRTSYL